MPCNWHKVCYSGMTPKGALLCYVTTASINLQSSQMSCRYSFVEACVLIHLAVRHFLSQQNSNVTDVQAYWLNMHDSEASVYTFLFPFAAHPTIKHALQANANFAQETTLPALMQLVNQHVLQLAEQAFAEAVAEILTTAFSAFHRTCAEAEGNSGFVR